MASTFEEMLNYAGAFAQTAGSLLGLFTNPTPPEDTSVIALNGWVLPCIVQQEDVDRQLIVEQVAIEGQSGTVKLVHGWGDAILRYVVTMTTDDIPDGAAGTVGALLSGDIASFIASLQAANVQIWTALDKLKALDFFFKQFGADGANPMIFDITQELAEAAGVKRVLFVGLTPSRSSSSDRIDATLQFLEYQPATVLIETGQAQPNATTPEMVTTNSLETMK